MILPKRLQQAMFEGSATLNRDQGSASGQGGLPMASLGVAAGSSLGTYSTANASTYTTIASTTVTVQITRATYVFYLWTVTLHGLLGSSGNCYIRGVVDGFTTTEALSILNGGGTNNVNPRNASLWHFPPTLIPPGAYVVHLDIATDNGVQFAVDQAANQLFALSA